MTGNKELQAEYDALPTVSIAVVVRDEAEHIAGCLEALKRQDYPQERLEIVIVDGGSTDGTMEIVRHFLSQCTNMRLIERPGCSYPAGLNIALQQARGEIWAFVDGHATVQHDHITRHVAYLKRTGAACVGGLIRTTGEGYLGCAIAHALSTPFGVGNARFRHSDPPRSSGCYVDTVPYGAYRRKLVQAAGGFDESRLRSADLELHSRIRALGGNFYLAPDICTRYFSRPTLKRMMGQAFANGYPLARTLRAASPRHFVPALFVAALVVTLLASPWLQEARLAFLGISGAYLSLDFVFSALTAQRQGWRYFPALLLIYPLLHTSYGAGSLAGFRPELSATTAPAGRGCAPREG
ncbi:glycosyltransferase family 2 protein [Geomonas sp. RF6]|uniref:glycosyltransferase family 2 protein n=1 Tax=Geomonas sp. RF6 TaxID=2897342 RepID=UPI001E30AAD5|nr:glycosyltransferase family 2 protein [Geomonas sp. RF6]UFS69345.1 glycosyltransferase family 2 protein [Geomonas sp. RF6]